MKTDAQLIEDRRKDAEMLKHYHALCTKLQDRMYAITEELERRKWKNDKL